jgi:hypothetical protein
MGLGVRSRSHRAIVKVSPSTIKVMMAVKNGGRCRGRGRGTKNIREGGNSRSDSRSNGVIEERVESTRGNGGRGLWGKGRRIVDDGAGVTREVENFVIVDVKRFIGANGGIFDQDIGTGKERRENALDGIDAEGIKVIVGIGVDGSDGEIIVIGGW